MLLLLSLSVTILLITSFLTLLESVLTHVDEIKLSYILRNKVPRTELLKKIVTEKQAYLSSIILLINLTSIGGSSLTGGMATTIFGGWESAVYTATLTYCMLVFAKMLPKLMGPQCAEWLLPKATLIIHVLYIIIAPLRWITLVWLKLFRVDQTKGHSLNELKYILRHYNDEGLIGRDTRKMVVNLLDIGDKTIKNLIKYEPPAQLPASAAINDVIDIISDNSVKRFALMEGDNILGIVSKSRINKAIREGEGNTPLFSLAKNVIYLQPETTLMEAFNQFNASKAPVAIVGSKEHFGLVTARQVYRTILKSGKKKKKISKSKKYR